jgi:Histidine phosphatase superfamily (branch 1)
MKLLRPQTSKNCDAKVRKDVVRRLFRQDGPRRIGQLSSVGPCFLGEFICRVRLHPIDGIALAIFVEVPVKHMNQARNPILVVWQMDTTASAATEMHRLSDGTEMEVWSAKDRIIENYVKSHREHLLLHEQQFGLFDGLSDNERRETFPEMQAYYEKCKQYEGKLWPIMPLGESRIQVCSRVHQTFGTFHRDHDKHGISTIVVVGHGTTNRAFIQMWLHKEWEWMHNEPNPNNCSIRLIESGEDCGYIFNGFDSTKNP